MAPLRLRPRDVADYQRYFLRERAARGGASKRPKLSPEVRFPNFGVVLQDGLVMRLCCPNHVVGRRPDEHPQQARVSSNNKSHV